MSDNPCNVKAPANTAACESLPSQIENFTLEFFGEVFKTEVDGQVQWSLPGRLDVGLPLNPRGASEPLGCYLLRLLQNGIVGGQGERGGPGRDGCNGNTPYVQVLIAFAQPAKDVAFPILVTRNPSILSGMDVLIEGSGWYEIVTSDGKGNLTVALRKAVVNPQSIIPVGAVLLPSGKVGESGAQGVQGIQGVKGGKGPKGDLGNQGPQGVAGSSSQVTLPLYKATIPQFAINFPSAALVDGYEGGFSAAAFTSIILFPGAVPCKIILPTAGTYLVMARAGWGATPLTVGPGQVAAQAQLGANYFQIKNISTNTVIPQSLALVALGLGHGEQSRIVTFVSTLAANNVIQLQAKALTGAGVVSVHYFMAFKIS